MNLENKLKSIQQFNKNELSFILSLLIGDGSLSDTGRMVIAHGNQQKDYCEWKAKKLTEIIKQEIKALPTRQCTQIQFQRKLLKDLRYKIYTDNRKNIYNILKYITNPIETVAIWICDDGNVSPSITNGKCYSSSIQIFTFTELEETIKICDWFERNLGIRPNAHFRDRSKSGRKSAYILKFNAENSRKLYKKIKPFIPDIDSMKYKFRYIEYNLSTRPQQVKS